MLKFHSPETLLAERTSMALQEGVIDLWGVSLTGGPGLLGACERLLEESERTRAARFVFERDRNRFLIAHAVLRGVLARYVSLAPDQLRFEIGAAGKPELRLVPGVEPALRFNLSHSEDVALIGVTTRGALGVDLEAVRADPGLLEIAHHYFFGDEHTDIDAAPAAEQSARFFQYWVAKESVLKAQGIGLGFALDRFAVRFDSPARDTAGITTLDRAQLYDAWSVRMLATPPGWAAAATSAGRGWSVRYC